MKNPDLEAYCEHVEHEFFRLKGRPGTLSPADFARTRAWFEQGVPLEAVLEGVTRAFEAQHAGRDSADEEVNGLGFCEPFVERAASRRGSF